MILIDTHIWVWWANNDPQLPSQYRAALDDSPDGVGLCVFSCWEVAKKVEKESRRPPEARTLILNMPVQSWINAAIRLPGLAVIPLTPEIALESANLPDDYNLKNKDPGDQIIIATSRVEKLPLMTVDEKITPYRHVDLWTSK